MSVRWWLLLPPLLQPCCSCDCRCRLYHRHCQGRYTPYHHNTEGVSFVFRRERGSRAGSYTAMQSRLTRETVATRAMACASTVCWRGQGIGPLSISSRDCIKASGISEVGVDFRPFHAKSSARCKKRTSEVRYTACIRPTYRCRLPPSDKGRSTVRRSPSVSLQHSLEMTPLH
ncbi:unnamed protein product [Scytosiphon promiscuus]